MSEDVRPTHKWIRYALFITTDPIGGKTECGAHGGFDRGIKISMKDSEISCVDCLAIMRENDGN